MRGRDHPAVIAERVRALYQKAHLALAAVAINASILVVVLWNHRPRTVLVGWLVAVFLIAAARALHSRRYKTFPPPEGDARKWGAEFTVGSGANGIAWGIGGILLYDPTSLPLQVLVVFVIGGMCAGAVTSNASHPPALAAYVIPAMLPVALRMLLELDAVHIAMGAMLVLFSIMMIGIGRTAAKQLSETVELRLGREQLIEQLAAATSELEEANRTVERRAIEDRERLEGELAHSRLLATLGRLASGVAHEVNNPLTYVMSNLQFLSNSMGTLSAEQREALSEAEEGASRIRTIVGDLTALSHRESDPSLSSDVNQLLRSCVTIMEGELHRCATVKLKLAEIPVVFGDRTRLSQVFLNLLTNAVQSIPTGETNRGMIEVRTSLDDNGHVVVEVADNGCGIPDSKVGQVFEPFFTTKAVGDGTGLGLSIARGLVEGLGGSIGMTSRVGMGTTVQVRLRAAPVEARLDSRPEPTPPPSSDAGSFRARVLIVDDDPMVMRSLVRMLKPHHVDSARSADAALTLIKGDRDAYDIIFCDVVMPHISGTELFQQVLNEMPEVAERFVFITGATTPEARAFLDGIPNLCIGKPFEPGVLAAAIAGAARRPRRLGQAVPS